MAAQEEDDDYMNMTFDAAEYQKQPETSLQRSARQKKEAAERARPISKAERAERDRVAREEALATALPSTNKGAKMLAKMGFTPGSTLGKSDEARAKPVEVSLKDDRGGIGMESEKKRKIREAGEEAIAGAKKQKVEAVDFRERNARERGEKRNEGMMWSAMRTLEGFETEGGESAGETSDENQHVKGNGEAGRDEKKPLKEINILYRSVVARRREREQKKALHKHDLSTLLPRRADYNDDPELDNDDKHALGAAVEELDPDDGAPDEDVELADFQALSAAERLEKVVKELREKFFYCFWCKYKYPDAEMDGCPGSTEDEHG